MRPSPPPPPRKYRPSESQVLAKTDVLEIEEIDLLPDDPSTVPPPDLKTPGQGSDIGIYQSLLSVFDEMSPVERFDFVEMAFLFKGLTSDQRKALIIEAGLFHVVTPTD